MLVDINNLSGFAVDENLLKAVANKVLKEERIRGKRELSIVLIGKQEMKALNQRFRNEKRATDVLTFPAPSVMIENKGGKRIKPQAQYQWIKTEQVTIPARKYMTRTKNDNLTKTMSIMIKTLEKVIKKA